MLGGLEFLNWTQEGVDGLERIKDHILGVDGEFFSAKQGHFLIVLWARPVGERDDFIAVNSTQILS